MDFLDNKKKYHSPKEDKTKENKLKERNKSVDVQRYKDQSGLTVGKLDWGLFYIEQRENLKTIWNSFLIFAAIMIWGIFVLVYARYAINGAKMDSMLLKQVVNNGFIANSYFISKQAKPLEIATPQAISGRGVYDFFVEIKNPNVDFWAEFDYYFTNGKQEIERKKGFIFPWETKYLISLNHELVERISTVNLVIENLKWARTNSHKYGVWKKFYTDHLNIIVDNEKFTNHKLSGISEKEKLSTLQFTAKNNTAYNYDSMSFLTVLKSGLRVVGINRYETGEFMSGETKNVNITMSVKLPKVSSIEIQPEQLITKKDVYIDFVGDSDKILP